jgi:hypothetical protein
LGNNSISYPLRHVSIRVPWHDSGWAGTVCKGPKFNTACLKLKGIAESKNEVEEEKVQGKTVKELLDAQLRLPPCVKERATFMANFDFSRQAEHPYTQTSPATHGHFRPTALRHPAYSAAAVPFRWMMRDVAFGNPKEGIVGLVDHYPLEEVDQKFEPTLSFDTNWMQDHRNHRALLECFAQFIRLCS